MRSEATPKSRRRRQPSDLVPDHADLRRKESAGWGYPVPSPAVADFPPVRDLADPEALQDCGITRGFFEPATDSPRPY